MLGLVDARLADVTVLELLARAGCLLVSYKSLAGVLRFQLLGRVCRQDHKNQALILQMIPTEQTQISN